MRGGRPRRQAMTGAPVTHPDTPWSDMTRRAPRTLSTITEAQTTRRQLLAMATVGGVGVAGVAAAGPAQAAQDAKKRQARQARVHAHRDRHHRPARQRLQLGLLQERRVRRHAHRDIGVAKAATLIKADPRRASAPRNTLTLDAGDTIQGTPLAYYYAKIEPITGGTMHPMAAAMNAIGYDAAALGNHEFNYGLDLLRAFQSQCHHPLLSANTVDWNTGAPLFPPYVIKTVKIPGQKPLTGRDPRPRHARCRHLGQGQRRGQGQVPRHRRAGQGLRPASQGRRRRRRRRLRSTPAPSPRRPTATRCPIPRTPAACWPSRCPASTRSSSATRTSSSTSVVTNTTTGKQVLLVEPLYWGMRLSLDGPAARQGAAAAGSSTTPRSSERCYDSNTVPEDAAIAALVRPRRTTRSSRTSTASSAPRKQAMSAATSPVRGHRRDGLHQLRPGRRGEEGPGRHARRDHCRCSRSPRRSTRRRRSRPATSPCATWPGCTSSTTPCWASSSPAPRCKPTSSSRRAYFKQVTGTGPFPADDGHQRRTPTGTERYARLQLRHHGRARRPLTYDIDIAQPVGSAASRTSVCGCAGDAEPGVHHRDEQLPPVRRWQLPAASRRLRSSTTPRSRSASCSSTGSPPTRSSTRRCSPRWTGSSSPTASR